MGLRGSEILLVALACNGKSVTVVGRGEERPQNTESGSLYVAHVSQVVLLQVPLARSETHLSELLDGVCDSMSDYALHVDPDTQLKQFMRFAPRSGGATGDFPDFKNFQFDGPEASNALKFACESVVEELEDDIISLFSQDVEHVHQELCNRVSGYCKESRRSNKEL